MTARMENHKREGSVTRTRFLPVIILAALLLASLGFAQVREPVDLDAIYRIKEEGLQRSQVMDIMSYLTDIHGPRLTGSPNIWAAGDWAKSKLTEWGLENVELETWEPFGRGWSNQRFTAHVVSPQEYPLIGAALAWTPGTDGPVRGDAIHAPLENPRQLDAYKEKYKGKLKGKFVLTTPMREVAATFEAPGRRYTDEQLAERARQPVQGGRRGQPDFRRRFRGIREARRKVREFYREEGVAAVVTASRWDKGILLVSSGGSRDPKDPLAPTQFMLSIENYGRILRTLEKEIPVTLEVDIQSTFHDEKLNSFNVVAEIPGTDKADELVMLGAHFDSWHSGTGATDNGAGSAAMMEAMRILKASGLKMRRTVRLGLWTGEEQGFLGSRAYIKEHFANRQTMELKPDHGKFSVYFNIDNGTGKLRGVYLQGNEAAAPVLRSWMKPFENVGMTTLSIRNTGGTDHLAFDAVGLPGFQFIQDPVEYGTRTHHSNQDTYERIQEADMKQMAVIAASFVYHAANREKLFPRKPLPEPPPPQEGGPRF